MVLQKKEFYERLPIPGGGRNILPSYICPDCRKHKRLEVYVGNPQHENLASYKTSEAFRDRIAKVDIPDVLNSAIAFEL